MAKKKAETSREAPPPIAEEPKPAPKPKKPEVIKVTGPTATCPSCGDVREVSNYYDPKVHEQRCPTCYSANR